MPELYDRIGASYARWRQADPRIAASIAAALGTARSVLNVGAGCGSYEPRDRRVVAVEPALTMIRQRPADAAPVVQASAAALPFRAHCVDLAMAILTLHHWPDPTGGVQELVRVARQRVVLLTLVATEPPLWLTDYLPEIQAVDDRLFPPLDWYRRQLGHIEVVPVPIPHDCRDGFLGAYWRRPHAYLDPERRSAISAFARLSDPLPGLERLRRDLGSGAWQRRHAAMLRADHLDLGYRLVVADVAP